MLNCIRWKTAGAKGFAVLSPLSVVVLSIAGTVAEAEVVPRIDVIVISGDPVPSNEGGAVAQITGGTLNDSGDVAFRATIADSGVPGDRGIFRANTQALTQIARHGQPRGDGLGTINDLFRPTLNNAGQLAFQGTSAGEVGGFPRTIELAYLSDAETDAAEIVAQTFSPLPGGDSLSEISRTIAINGAGNVAFRANVAGGTPGIFFGKPDSLLQIDQGLVSDPTINDMGTIAYVKTVSLSPSNNALYYYDGADAIEVARGGDAVPGAGQTFSGTFQSNVSLNESGQLTFSATVSPISGNVDDVGLFVFDPVEGITEPVARRTAPPDGNGEFHTIRQHFINNNGLIAFKADLENTVAGVSDDGGLFLTDTSGSFLQNIAREGQPVPSGNGFFVFVGSPALNENNHLAFFSSVQWMGEALDALFLYDESFGLAELLREGDELLGSTITSLDLQVDDFPRTNEGHGLNNHGQVAFTFTLADARQGIAIATLVPEPSSYLLLATGLVSLLLGATKP